VAGLEGFGWAMTAAEKKRRMTVFFHIIFKFLVGEITKKVS